MKRDDIIKAAAAVGAHRYTNRHLPGEPSHAFSIEQLEDFVRAVQPVHLEDAIARSKRILALVDDYHERPTSDTRGTLRKALMSEFEALGVPGSILAAPVDGACRCTFAQRMQGDGCEACNPGAAA